MPRRSGSPPLQLRGRGNLRDMVQHRLDDAQSRALKAAKILAILDEVLGPEGARRVCLDVGSAHGLITRQLAPHFGQSLGVEQDAQAVCQAAKFASPRLGFIQGDALNLPLGDQCADVVICAQVYEHVADAMRLFDEIWRVLVPGGICFLSGPNKLYPIELHYGLPFVQWLPVSWASAWLRATGRAEAYDVRSLTLWTLRRYLQGFEIQDYTAAMLRQPDRYASGGELGRWRWIGKLPPWLLRGLLPVVPNFNWVLRKPLSTGRERRNGRSGAR